MTVGGCPEWLQRDLRRGHRSLGTRPRVEGRGRDSRWVDTAACGCRRPQQPPGASHATEPGDPARECVAGERSAVRPRPGEGYVGSGTTRVGQAGEHREASDPVGENVMKHHHQRPLPALEPGHEHHRPERPGAGKRFLDHGESEVQQLRPAARRAAGHLTDVVGDVERVVVDPDRSSAAERYRHQPLAQARHRRHPLGHQPAHLGEVEPLGVVEQQNDAELLRHRAGVHRQEGAVGSARPLDDLCCRRHESSEGSPTGGDQSRTTRCPLTTHF